MCRSSRQSLLPQGTTHTMLGQIDKGRNALIIAGRTEAVAWKCHANEQEFELIGLTFNMTKSSRRERRDWSEETGTQTLAQGEDNPGWRWNPIKNSKNLGAAIGDRTCCEEILSNRRTRQRSTGQTGGLGGRAVR